MKKQSKKRKTNKKDNFKILIIINCIQTLLILILAIHIWSIGGESSTKSNKTQKTNTISTTDLKDENYVFLGDSITDWYPISNFFSDDTPIIKSGFAGYKTYDLLKDMDNTVYKYNPTKVFIQIGTNDLNCDDSSSEVAYNNIVKIIKNIKKNRPYAEIYLESIYPVNQSDDEKIQKETTGKRNNEEIAELNGQLEEYCKNNEVKYIDMYKELVDEEGNLKLEYTADGLHLSTEGYSKVSNVLKKYIKEN